MYLNSFNHFRAIAILFVVAGHCYKITGLNFDTMAEYTLVNLITGGTSLFVFISGFLFHHVFYKKYQYKTFITGKVKNILIPYLLLSFIPVCLYVHAKTNGWNGYFYPQGSGFFYEYFIPALKFYWTGAFLGTYWYIPFIFVTFMLSPLHFFFIKAKPSWQFGITGLFFIIAVLIHRPLYNLSVWQSVIYYTATYLIGILCSIHKTKIYATLAGKELILLVIVLMLALLQAQLGVVGNYNKAPFVYNGIDIMYIQKLFLCLFFMVYLHRFESFNNSMVKALADTSFSVFFLHPFVLWLGKHKAFAQYTALDSWLVYACYVVAVTFLCVLIAKLIKKITPNYSRYLVGY